MIQRIQSIFLLLAAVAFGLMLVLPMASTPEAGADVIFADTEYTVQDNVVLVILALLGVVVSIVALFLFRKRPVQLRLGYLIIVIGILLPLIAYLYFTNQSGSMADTEVRDEFGLFLPFVALICAGLAARFIRKDEKLVKSMDRLR